MINNWIKCSIKDLVKIQNGYAFKSERFVKNEIPVIKISSINNNQIIIDNSETYPPINICEDFIVKKNDILIAMSGATTGKVGVYCHNNIAYLNQRVCKFVIKSNKFHYDYLRFWLNSDLFRLQMNTCLAAGAQPNLSPKQIGNMDISLPSEKNEQELITKQLIDIDSLIENLEKLIEKKKNIKLGTMQELLTGKKRLPGFTKEWEEKSLGELGVFTGGGVDKKLVAGQKPVTLLNFLDVYHKDFIYKRELHHEVTASDAQIRKCTLKKGDVFFTPSSEMRTDLAMSAVVMEDCPGYVYSYHITRFRFNDNFDIKFKSYVFNTKYFLDQASLICEGSGKRYVVNLSKFKNLTIKYPTDIKEQTAIAEIIWDIDQEIHDLEQQLGKYKQIKQGMMEQLLTGKIRLVSDAQESNIVVMPKHNQMFDDAVVFANIVASCYDERYPLGRKKCQKMMYLFKRFNNASVEQFGHYAAGPYDNKARYGGFESIAIKNKYVVESKSEKGSSFAPGEDIEKAQAYCSKYGYDKFIPIFNKYLKYLKVDELELYTTVDKTILELQEQNKQINLQTVKDYIANDKTWVPKLSRDVFNDENIESAISFSQEILKN